MAEGFVGEVRMFAFSFPPIGWARCDGQLLPIAQFTALFSILGTAFGGNGTVNFALPNFADNIPVGVGQGQGLSSYDLGQTGGEASVKLKLEEVPLHNHVFNAVQANGTTASSVNARVATVSATGTKQNKFTATLYSSTVAPSSLVSMSPSALALAGADTAHNNLMPYLTVGFCIALAGIFPPRA